MNSIRFILLLISFSCFVVHAASYRSGEVVRISEGDTLFSDLIAAGRVVEIQGNLQGDAYSGCQEITVQGEITDDLLAAARTVTIRGAVKDMVIGFGEKITIDGEVGGDVLAFCGEVRITERAHVKGNVYTGTGSFRLEGGRIEGWLHGSVGALFLNGYVGQNVELKAGNVEFGPHYDARAGTKLTLSEPLNKEDQMNIPDNLEIVIEEKSGFYQSGYFYWSLVSMFVTGLLIGLFFKQSIRNLLSYSHQNILKNSGIGLMVVFLTPLTIGLLIIPLITIPAALILAALYAILLYLGILFSGLYLGSYLFSLIQKGEALGSLILPFIVGLLILVLLIKIPIIGTLIQVILICLGSGSIVNFLWTLKRGTGQTA
jgi:cytoskeletal protein CcmA (bactofilin family)